MEKARTIEFKKSGYFRRCPQIGKEQPDSLLELTIPLSASLTAGEIGYDIESVCGDCSWKSNLCWAACAAGVMGADGVGEHQCSIVEDANFLELGENGCRCCNDTFYTDYYCNYMNYLYSSVEVNDVYDVLKFHSIGSRLVSGVMPADSAQTFIREENPFIIGFAYGHFVLAHGYTYDPIFMALTLQCMDPADATIWREKAYSDWVDDGWYESLVANIDAGVTILNDPICYLEYFHPILESDGVRLEWKPQALQNTASFFLEKRDVASRTFHPIGHVPAKNHDDASVEYSFLDPAGRAGDLYRIVEVDQAGKRGIIEVAEVSTRDKIASINRAGRQLPDAPITPAKDQTASNAFKTSPVLLNVQESIIYDWLVVYPEEYSYVLSELVQWRAQTGHSPYAISIESITGDPWNTTLKQFIKDFWLWQGKRLQYVLLVGDGSIVIPIDIYYDGPSAFPDKPYPLGPIYKSDIALGDINDDGFAEIAVGRIPANTIDDVRIYIHKLIDYESSPADAWADSISLYVYAVDANYCDGATTDSLAALLALSVAENKNVHYNCVTNETLEQYPGDLRYSIFEQEMNSGRSLILGFATSSDDYRFVGWGPTIDSLQNDHPLPFEIGASCMIGVLPIVYGGRLGEYLFAQLHRGIIGAFAPSAGTWQSGNYVASYYMLQYLYNWGAPSAGYACLHAQRQVMERFPELASTARSYNFFGDPALKIAGSITCNPNYSVSIQSPKASNYEYEQRMTIKWNCTGCPWKIHIKIVEDYFSEAMIADFSQYESPDLASGSVTWTVRGISSDYENHFYNIKILVWDLASSYREASSSTFRIVEDLPNTKDDGIIPIDPVAADASGYYLPGLSAMGGKQNFSAAMILPNNLMLSDETIALSLRGRKRETVNFDSIALFAIDVASDCTAFLKDYKLYVSKDGREYAIDDAVADFGIAGLVEIAKAKEMMSYSNISLAQNDSIFLNFRVAPKKESARRYHLLKYCGKILAGEESTESEFPTEFCLLDPLPNPFNPSTIIEFQLPVRARVSIDIFDVRGAHIKNLCNTSADRGTHRIKWDGCNKTGYAVSSGIYFCRLTINKTKTLNKKIVLLR